MTDCSLDDRRQVGVAFLAHVDHVPKISTATRIWPPLVQPNGLLRLPHSMSACGRVLESVARARVQGPTSLILSPRPALDPPTQDLRTSMRDADITYDKASMSGPRQARSLSCPVALRRAALGKNAARVQHRGTVGIAPMKKRIVRSWRNDLADRRSAPCPHNTRPRGRNRPSIVPRAAPEKSRREERDQRAPANSSQTGNSRSTWSGPPPQAPKPTTAEFGEGEMAGETDEQIAPDRRDSSKSSVSINSARLRRSL
jgi:hypothetical protein